MLAAGKIAIPRERTPKKVPVGEQDAPPAEPKKPPKQTRKPAPGRKMPDIFVPPPNSETIRSNVATQP